MYKFILTLLLLMSLAATGYSGKVEFIAELPTPGEFTLFASGGWTGNWFVGYNQSWISALPPVDTGDVERVFIGARLGRAKTPKQVKERVSGEEEIKDFNPGPHTIMIGVSDAVEKKPSGRLAAILTTTDKIPLEGSPVAAIERVGESRWFWVEVDREILSDTHKNYLFLWSEDKELNSAEVSPILAAGIGSTEKENSFIITEGAPRVIKFFEPALAIKLVGANSPAPAIRITNFDSHPIDPMKQVVEVDVSGDDITEVNIELNSGDGWESTNFTQTSPPYNLVFNFKDLEPGKYELRVIVRNWYEVTAYSNIKTFEIFAE